MHLFPGTASDNAKDAIMKNRAYKFKIRPRAKNQSATLTDWDVEEIIYRHLNTATTKKALAQEHNVSDTMVARAISGIFWKHVQRGRIMIKVEINGDFRLAKDQSGKLKGFCDINLGENLMIIRNVRLIEGRNGLFAAMPAKYTEAKEGEDRGKYYSYIFFPNDEGSERSSLHQKITEAMTVAWREKAKESGGGAAGVKGKGSLTDMLGKGQG
jgi:DNA-binding cell septation regulator SpoVG